MEKITNGLYTGDFHFHCNASLFFSFRHQTCRLPDHGICCPDFTKHIRNAHFIEYRRQLMAVPDFDIVCRFRKIIGASLAAIAFCRDNELTFCFFPIQTTARAEHHKFRSSDKPVCLITQARCQCRTDCRQIKSDIRPFIIHFVNRNIPVTGCKLRDFFTLIGFEQMRMDFFRKDNQAFINNMLLFSVKILQMNDRFCFDIITICNHSFSPVYHVSLTDVIIS